MRGPGKKYIFKKKWCEEGRLKVMFSHKYHFLIENYHRYSNIAKNLFYRADTFLWKYPGVLESPKAITGDEMNYEHYPLMPNEVFEAEKFFYEELSRD